MKLKKMKISGIIILAAGILLMLLSIIFEKSLSKIMREIMSWLSQCLLVLGAARLVRSIRLSNCERAQEYENSFKDERIAQISNKARALTLVISIYAQIAAGLIFKFAFKEELVAMTLFFFACAQCIIYVVLYNIYDKKN